MSTCSICVEDSNVPVCCVPCGHVYCQNCITEWQRKCEGTSKCPECRELINDVILIYIKTEDWKDEPIMQLKNRLTTYHTSLTQKEKRVRYLLDQLQDQRQKTATCQEGNTLLEKSLAICNTNLLNLSNELHLEKQMRTKCEEENQFLLTENKRLKNCLEEQKQLMLKTNTQTKFLQVHLWLTGLLRSTLEQLMQLYTCTGTFWKEQKQLLLKTNTQTKFLQVHLWLKGLLRSTLEQLTQSYTCTGTFWKELKTNTQTKFLQVHLWLKGLLQSTLDQLTQSYTCTGTFWKEQKQLLLKTNTQTKFLQVREVKYTDVVQPYVRKMNKLTRLNQEKVVQDNSDEMWKNAGWFSVMVLLIVTAWNIDRHTTVICLYCGILLGFILPFVRGWNIKCYETNHKRGRRKKTHAITRKIIF